jgi:hypothetical protein
MHNRTLVVWFGMVLGAALLGCPPSAKSAKDSQQEAAPAAAPEGQQGEVKDEKKDEQKSAQPAPSGGW